MDPQERGPPSRSLVELVDVDDEYAVERDDAVAEQTHVNRASEYSVTGSSREAPCAHRRQDIITGTDLTGEVSRPKAIVLDRLGSGST